MCFQIRHVIIQERLFERKNWSCVQQRALSRKVSSFTWSLHKFFNYKFFYFCEHIWKINVSKDHCFAQHVDKMCFLPNGRYHIKLKGVIEDVLQKMDAFCFTYQNVDYLYRLWKYRFSDKVLPTVEKCLRMYREQLVLINEAKDWTECPALGKRGSWERVPSAFTGLSPKNKINAN